MELNIVDLTRSKSSGKVDKTEGSSIITNSNDKVGDLKKIIQNNLGIKLDFNRMGLFLSNDSEKKTLLANNEKCLRDYNISDKMTILVKDLGPQVGWRFTYIVEYLGPLLLIIFFFLRLGPKNTNTTQKLALIMSTFHYSKRVLESIFVHQFSSSTMPFKNLIINCTYYWGIYGIVCGYSLFNQNYKEPEFNAFIRYFFAFLFFSAEIKNLKCHLILKELKEKNQGGKGIPHGEGFEYVSCANYFWEFVAWVCFSVFVNLIPFYIFTLFGFLIMKSWAQKKHREYIKNFPDRYPKNRKAIIPFLI